VLLDVTSAATCSSDPIRDVQRASSANAQQRGPEMRRRRPEPRRREVEIGLERSGRQSAGPAAPARLKGNVSNSRPSTSTHCSASDDLALLSRCSYDRRCSVSRTPTSRSTAPRASMSRPAVSRRCPGSPRQLGHAVDLDRTLEAVARVVHELVKADRGERWLPLGPASRPPSTARTAPASYRTCRRTRNRCLSGTLHRRQEAVHPTPPLDHTPANGYRAGTG
jgi:hypothetical protein